MEKSESKMMKEMMMKLGTMAMEKTLAELPVEDRLMWENSWENIKKLAKKHKMLALGAYCIADELTEGMREE